MAVTSCIYEADYSLVTGDHVFPYVFSLNLDQSVLSPSAGQYQTFCYDIVGVAKEESEVSAMEYFLLGICPSISRTDIAAVAVSVNGEAQTVVWGENVSLKTVDDPDTSTEHAGLKLMFPLNPISGEMQVSISMLTVHDIGPMDITLYGDDAAATGLSVCGPVCGSGTACESVVYQNETVCVPVTVTPFAKPGTARTTCCGAPTVSADVSCVGTNTSCTFSVSQSLCIAIPVSFGAAVKTGTAAIQCGTPSETGCDCTDGEDTK
jgi:hypothetical protein